MKYFSIFIVLILLSSISAEEDHYVAPNDPLVIEKLEKWQDIKFGLLMHWGAYSQWGIVESWSLCPEDYGWCERKKGENPQNYFEYKKEYENLKNTFNPVKFDPSKWAKAAKDAGMKYVVFTTKHHDGFTMFNSKETNYKITDKGCPFHTNEKADVTKEIFDAFRAQGLWAGAYFSKPDWHNENYWYPYFPPLDRNVNYDPEEYPERWENFVQFTHNQIMELMTDYGKVDILWLDGGWVASNKGDMSSFYQKKAKESPSGFIKNRVVNQDIRMDELVEKARKKQPGLIVVDRAVPGKNQNYLTPENRVPATELPFPWESCIISGGGWSWTPNAKYKSGKETVHMLVDIVAKGGNLLLNIAPGPDGSWHDGAYKLLSEMGSWMDVNSEAIYNTRAIAPYKEGKVCLTQNKKTKSVYAIYLPSEDEENPPAKIWLSTLQPADGADISFLGAKEKLKWEKVGTGVSIEIPEKLQKNPPSKYAWAIKISEISSDAFR